MCVIVATHFTSCDSFFSSYLCFSYQASLNGSRCNDTRKRSASEPISQPALSVPVPKKKRARTNDSSHRLSLFNVGERRLICSDHDIYLPTNNLPLICPNKDLYNSTIAQVPIGTNSEVSPFCFRFSVSPWFSPFLTLHSFCSRFCCAITP